MTGGAEEETAQLLRWRVSLAQRVMWVVVVSGGTLLVALIGASGKASSTIPLLVAFVVAIALYAWRLGFRPYIHVTASDLVIQNPLRRRVLPLADIVGAEGGYYGLTVRTRTGQTVTAWAAQKSNLMSWLHRSTRADKVADMINASAARARMVQPEPR